MSRISEISIPSGPPDPRTLMELYVSREQKLARIHDIERVLGHWEREDEENDPELIKGHIRLTRGVRFGSAVFWFCLALMCVRTYQTGHHWAGWLGVGFLAAGIWLFVRGLAYRPDPHLIYTSYEAHRGRPEYRRLIAELEILSRALSQELRAEDEA